MTTLRASVAVLALAVCAGAFGAKRADAQQADVALVYRLLQGGDMRVIRPPQPEPGTQAHVGDRLRNLDKVTTSGSTRAALRFTDDGSILRLNPNSSVVLTSGNENGVVVRTLRLEAGELWTRVNRHQGITLRVNTPAGVAAVKGTEFVVRVDHDGTTTVITLEGVVEFFNQGGRVDVPAGTKVTAADSSSAPRAQPATPQELQQAQGARGDEGGSVQGTWIEVRLRDANGQTRTLMLQVPADAVRNVLEGRP